MSALLRLRAEREHMSAIERRIADFILDNALLLRDYSSQQLAAALGISQSSVVKFSQKLGFRGYPDLKFSVAQEARPEAEVDAEAARRAEAPDPSSLDLWRRKSDAEAETRTINTPSSFEYVASLLDRAGRVFVFGVGEDAALARLFAHRLAMLGILAVAHDDLLQLTANVATARLGDVLIAISEHGRHPALSRMARAMHERSARVVSVTRHSANPLRAHADLSLLVSAHDDRPHIGALLYQAGAQHLLDRIFIALCQSDGRLAQMEANLEQIRLLTDDWKVSP
jgi:DNA-binding MurR/RpiR family transcriptional regulator